MTDTKQKEVFARNLNRLLARNHKTQKEVADAIGVLTTTFNTWCTGVALPRMGKVQLLADYFGVLKSDLIEDKPNATDSDGVLIPVYGRVAAGEPIEASQDNIVGYEKIDKDMARRGDFYALQIKGDSMTPMICDGDTIIVREQPDAENGEIVVATINGDDATCKRLRKYKGGIELISINPSYEPYTFDKKDIEEVPVRILGKVVEMRRRFA